MKLKTKNFLRKLFSYLGYEIKRKTQDVQFDFYSIFLGINSTVHRPILTIQIGANDGKTNDPIFTAAKHFSSKIILVEPQVDLHDKLRSNYSDFSGELVILSNIIGDFESPQKLYRIRKNYHLNYFRRSNSNPTGISSLHEEHLKKMLIKNGFGVQEHPKMIEHILVESERLENLIKNYTYTHNIFLQIDCEGADWMVLKTLASARPNIINFEQKHLSQQDLDEVFNWLKVNGYLFSSHGGDCLAYRNKIQ